MNITNAQYVLPIDGNTNNKTIKAIVDGVELCIPVASGNRHYDEIMRQVAAGELTIAGAD